MDQKQRDILAEHLRYELDMIDAAVRHLEAGTDGFWKNCAIEAFWLHARNVIEFLTHPPGGPPWQGTVSARDFTGPGYHPSGDIKTLDEKVCPKVNDQICHLNYERKSSPHPERTNEWDIVRVNATIGREIARLEAALTPESKSIWHHRNRIRIGITLPNETTTTRAVTTVVSILPPQNDEKSS